MKNEKKKVTLKSIANHLGMGQTTISDILLRDKTNYADSTIEKVRKTAKELGYVPNRIAQNLKNGKTKTIGLLICFDISNPYVKTILATIEKLISARGYMLQVALSHQDNEKNLMAMNIFESGHVDGMIVGPIYLKEDKEDTDTIKYNPVLPTVFFQSPVEVGNYTVNNKHDYLVGVEALLEAGHKKIGYLLCPNRDVTKDMPSDGYYFYKQLNDLGLFNPAWVWFESNSNMLNGYAMMKRILETTPKEKLPTAFLVHNDYAAMGVLAALNEANYKVPDDFSIVSNDNIEFAQFTNPPLSTVNKYAEIMAEEAVNLLFERMDNPQLEPKHIEIEEKFINRATIKNLI